MVAQTQSRVLWVQVCGLAAVQGAIALLWVIYNLYLAKLLTQFGFPAILATGLLIGENLLAIALEPLMGSLSDQAQQWVGSRFPMIAVGVILSSACFLAIPAIVVWGNPAGGLRVLLPIMLVAWALAMTIFRSPALSLLGRYAFATQLPQAASILTLVGGLAGALGPLAGQFLLQLGPTVTFGVGSIVLLVAATVLRSLQPQAQVSLLARKEGTTRMGLISWPALSLIFGAGLGITLGFRAVLQVFPQLLKQLPNISASLIMGLLFLALALAAIPMGTLATRLGNRLAMILGLLGLAGLTGLMAIVKTGLLAAIIAITFGVCLSLVFNGTLPFALSLVPPERAGLGTGVYFGGAALAGCIFGTLLTQSEVLTPSFTLGLAIVALSLAGGCIALSSSLTRR